MGTGDDARTYHVNESILKHFSPYFFALIDGDFSEASTRTVTLSDVNDRPAIFEAVLQYMYDWDYANIEDELGRSSNALFHGRVFAMAHRLCMEELEVLCVQKMSNEMEDGEPRRWLCFNVCKIIDVVYGNTPGPTNYVPTEKARFWAPKLASKKKEIVDLTKHDLRTPTQGADSKNNSRPASPAEKETRPSDMMRSLVARYCASKIDGYREDPDFKRAMAAFPDFVLDLLAAVSAGPPVESLPEYAV